MKNMAWLPPAVLTCALITCLSAGYKRQNTADDTLFILRLISLGLTMVAMFATVEDVTYYLCSFLMLHR